MSTTTQVPQQYHSTIHHNLAFAISKPNTMPTKINLIILFVLFVLSFPVGAVQVQYDGFANSVNDNFLLSAVLVPTDDQQATIFSYDNNDQRCRVVYGMIQTEIESRTGLNTLCGEYTYMRKGNWAEPINMDPGENAIDFVIALSPFKLGKDGKKQYDACSRFTFHLNLIFSIPSGAGSVTIHIDKAAGLAIQNLKPELMTESQMAALRGRSSYHQPIVTANIYPADFSKYSSVSTLAEYMAEYSYLYFQDDLPADYKGVPIKSYSLFIDGHGINDLAQMTEIASGRRISPGRHSLRLTVNTRYSTEDIDIPLQLEKNSVYFMSLAGIIEKQVAFVPLKNTYPVFVEKVIKAKQELAEKKRVEMARASREEFRTELQRNITEFERQISSAQRLIEISQQQLAKEQAIADKAGVYDKTVVYQANKSIIEMGHLITKYRKYLENAKSDLKAFDSKPVPAAGKVP